MIITPFPIQKIFPEKLIPKQREFEGALTISKTLHKNGFQCWFVGGCVRDALFKRTLHDFDLVTNATPVQIQHLFGKTDFVGVSFGIILVKLENLAIEVATLRKDGSYSDGRRPDSIEAGNLEEDSRRRDFTINSLYYDAQRQEVLDLHGGLVDLQTGVMRTVGEPVKRFTEDALRLLRAVRFASRFQLEVEPKTLNAISMLAETTRGLSGERLQQELTKMLCGPEPSRALRMLQSTGIMQHVLPEVSAMVNVSQGRRFHPEGDVFTHTLLGCECEPSRSKISRWGILLHDIGKPKTREVADGKITFYQHESVGAEMADVLLRRLKFSVEERQLITSVVSRHMRFMNASRWNNSTLRRFIAEKSIEHDLNVHAADCLSCHQILSAWRLVSDAYKNHVHGEPKTALPKALLGGNELISLGYKPSPLFGKFMQQLIDQQLEGLIETVEEARDFAGRFFEEHQTESP